ncbi:MAG TPA: chorismate mutase [Spirochaetota bacterium]
MALRGIRGAITVDENNSRAIAAATREMLSEIIEKNNLTVDDIASVYFSATEDIDAAYPAVAAREIGFSLVPLFCVQEMKVIGSLPRCIRALVHVNTERTPSEIHHVYLRGASSLRPDLSHDG